jgi:DNA/RNA endonuclease G (NUC1)
VYYYGDIRSFTTPAGEIVIGGDQPGWCETPVMNIRRSGGYMMNSSDETEYYAIHMCAGGEKGPGGRTARNYTVCYSGKYHCPVWVAAPRHSMYVGGSGRTDAYRQDPDIPSAIQYNSKSTGGGCNKGHMLGSAERTSSTATNRDVFYYTNIAPQLSANFNTGGGRWNVLEDYVDTQVCADTLYEVLGCYFDKYTDAYGETQTPSVISFGGRDDVAMPTMFYYVLLRTKKGNSGKALKNCSASELQCVAFVRSHVNVRQAVSRKELMSVSDLEKITGVTYFPNVPNAPKDTFSAADWGL